MLSNFILASVIDYYENCYKVLSFHRMRHNPNQVKTTQKNINQHCYYNDVDTPTARSLCKYIRPDNKSDYVFFGKGNESQNSNTLNAYFIYNDGLPHQDTLRISIGSEGEYCFSMDSSANDAIEILYRFTLDEIVAKYQE